MNSSEKMLSALLDQVKTAHCVVFSLGLKDNSDEQRKVFMENHPDVDMVIGDFAIRCIHPEKYTNEAG